MHEVVVGALLSGGRVLLVHRWPDKWANPDVWDLPGGVVEAGERELEALERELHEELGVQIAPTSVSHLSQITVGTLDAPARLSGWLVRDWRGTPSNTAPEEHDDLAWFDLDELPPPPHLLMREALLSATRHERRVW